MLKSTAPLTRSSGGGLELQSHLPQSSAQRSVRSPRTLATVGAEAAVSRPRAPRSAERSSVGEIKGHLRRQLAGTVWPGLPRVCALLHSSRLTPLVSLAVFSVRGPS